jgi:hypothetical protein
LISISRQLPAEMLDSLRRTIEANPHQPCPSILRAAGCAHNSGCKIS